MVVPLVLMNRRINQSRCERYIISEELYVWHKQDYLLLRTGISKSQKEKYLRTKF